MKSLSGPATTQKNARGNAPIILVEIKWSGSLIERFSDYDVTIGGVPYIGALVNVGEIVETLSRNRVGDVHVEILNADTWRESNLFLIFEPERQKTVWIYQYFDGLAAADKVLLFKGIIESPARGLSIDERRVRFNVVSYERKFNEDIGDLISADDFADVRSANEGQMMPIIVGDLSAVDVPCIPVAAPVDTVLDAELSISSTSMTVKDTDDFPSTGTLKIDAEQMTYTGKTATTFTGLTRETGGTSKCAHADGKTVERVLTGTNPYIYLVAGHECKAISDVKADGLSISGSVVELANTTLVSGMTLALVRFPSRPIIEDRSNVTDLAVVPEPSGHSSSGISNPSWGYDGDEDTAASQSSTGSFGGNLKLLFNDTLYQGKITKKIMTIKWSWTGAYTTWNYLRLSSKGSTYDLGSTPSANTRTWTQIFGTPSDDYDDLDFKVEYNFTADPSGMTINVFEMWLTVEFESGVTVTLKPTITCGVKGRKDNATGDYTGTANELVKFAPDIVSELLCEIGGAVLASDIDSSSFAAVRSTLFASGYKNAFRLTSQTKLLEIVNDVGFQAMAYLSFEAGVAHMKIKPSSLSGSVKELTDMDDFVDAKLRRGSTDGLRNLFEARYAETFYFAPDEDPGDDGGWSVTTREDATSQTTYGEKKESYEFHMNRNQTFVEAVLDQLKAAQKDIHYELVATTPLRDMELERADVVKISWPAFGIIKDLAEVKDVRRVIGNGEAGRPDAVRLALWIEIFVAFSAGSWGYVRISNNSWYFVIHGRIVARLDSTGSLYLRGFVLTDETLPATLGNPLYFNETRRTITFGLADNTCVGELDENGNLLLPVFLDTDKSISDVGSADEIDSDGSTLWANVGSTTVLKADASSMRIEGQVWTDQKWGELYG